MQRDSGLGSSKQGVTALFRFTASVCGDSGIAHVKFGGRHEVIAAADHRPFRNAGSDMNGGKVVYAVQRACGDHSARAARTLFGRLEDQFDGAVELRFMLLKHLREPQTNGGMPVVATGVHHSRIAGGKPVAERAMAVVERFA